MYITDLDHSSTRFYTALIVLAVPAIPAMPGVRALNHPAFLQRREAFCARRTHLHFDVPAGTMLGHPGVSGRIGAATPSSRPALVIRTASNKPNVSTNRCRLRPLIFLPPSYPRSGPPISVVVADLLSMQAALGVGSR